MNPLSVGFYEKNDYIGTSDEILNGENFREKGAKR
jgi:hypothetical protein